MTTTETTPTLVPSGDLPSSTLLIAGDTITSSSGGTYDHVFAGTGKVNATIPLAGRTEIDSALAAAKDAQKEWISWPVERRRDTLIRLADLVGEEFNEFARLTVNDYAPPISLAAGSMLTERYLRYYAGFVDKATGSSTPSSPYANSAVLNLVEHEPYGVVLAILPWNGPMVPVGLAVAPALAAGNAVLVKPPELSPFAPYHFGQLCVRAGIPAGLVSILPAGPEGSELMVRHPGIDKIHFTGGAPTARKIINAASENLTPVLTELGGKNPNVIFADADLDTAAQIAAFQGPLTQAGQSCACASRIIVQESVYDTFLEKMLGVIANAKVGDPWDPTTLVGPVVSQDAADRIIGVIDEAVDNRYGELVHGGKRLGGELADGFFIEPTVFSRVDPSSPLAQIETFGPVVSVIPFTDETDALRIANNSRYGLNSFVLTSDLTRAHRFARGLEAGSVWINTYSDMQPQSPYGGYKQSGTGRVGGLEGLLDFLQVKNIRIPL
jgi:aldehyde dehydrogenase (NAD+)